MTTETQEIPKRPLIDPQSIAQQLESVATLSGLRLVDMIQETPVLLVFLRHSGCTFCRETLSDLAKVRSKIEAGGTRIALVHMDDKQGVDALIEKNALHGVERICDPRQELYQAFGLRRGSFRQLAGFKVWWRGLIAGLFHGHGRGPAVADFRQMPGVFYLDKGIIARRFRHRSAADRPCYDDLCESGISEEN